MGKNIEFFMTARFLKAFNILKDAFFKDEIASNFCTSCAVGTLLHGCSFSLVSETLKYPRQHWYEIVFSYRRDETLTEMDKKNILRMESATGYSIEEISQIEHTFETTAEYYHEKDETLKIYNALCAVIDYIASLDGIDSEPYKKELYNHPGLA